MLMHSTDDDISFHYEAYRIIGDTAEIDDIIKSEGFANFFVPLTSRARYLKKLQTTCQQASRGGVPNAF